MSARQAQVMVFAVPGFPGCCRRCAFTWVQPVLLIHILLVGSEQKKPLIFRGRRSIYLPEQQKEYSRSSQGKYTRAMLLCGTLRFKRRSARFFNTGEGTAGRVAARTPFQLPPVFN